MPVYVKEKRGNKFRKRQRKKIPKYCLLERKKELDRILKIWNENFIRKLLIERKNINLSLIIF